MWTGYLPGCSLRFRTVRRKNYGRKKIGYLCGKPANAMQVTRGRVSERRIACCMAPTWRPNSDSTAKLPVSRRFNQSNPIQTDVPFSPHLLRPAFHLPSCNQYVMSGCPCGCGCGCGFSLSTPLTQRSKSTAPHALIKPLGLPVRLSDFHRIASSLASPRSPLGIEE